MQTSLTRYEGKNIAEGLYCASENGDRPALGGSDCLGEYDGVTIYEVPDEATASALILSVKRLV